jgi:serine/threonine-protein kinase HipA
MSVSKSQHIRVGVGESDDQVGRLMFNRSGLRESSTFEYDETWLSYEDAFQVSPDLPLLLEPQYANTGGRYCVFHGAFAESAPTGWAGRVLKVQRAIERKHADAGVARSPSSALDDLLAVDDEFRLGALRFASNEATSLNRGARATETLSSSALLSLQLRACHALEKREFGDEHLIALTGHGTALGGVRPKTTFVHDGRLVIAKFPSPPDETDLPRAEILALQLAAAAGISVPPNRVVVVEGMPIAVIDRFDRSSNGERLHFLSAAALLLVDSAEDHTYTEIAAAIRKYSASPQEDLEELWRRIVFSMLITNVDDHLRNHGFLHVGLGRWRLSPAFDVNPSPEKAYSAKTWLTEDSGPAASVADALSAAPLFGLSRDRAVEVLGIVFAAVRSWRRVAVSPVVGMRPHDLKDFATAFENGQVELGAKLLT